MVSTSAAVSAWGWLEIVKSQTPEIPAGLLVPPPQLLRRAGSASNAGTLSALFQKNMADIFFKA
jgi:hypothetical protein